MKTTSIKLSTKSNLYNKTTKQFNLYRVIKLKETIRDLRDYTPQSSLTQSKRGNELVAMLPAIEKGFNMMGFKI